MKHCDSAGDRGAASLLAVSCLGLLLLLGAALSVVGAMVAAHRQAQAAADLAALAGASAVVGGDPCGDAAAVAEANGGSVASCAVDGYDVVVEVVVPGPRWLGATGDLTGRARAGPAP